VSALDWRTRQAARAKVQEAIKDALDEGLPRAYTAEVYQQTCATVFEHVFESYGGTGEGGRRGRRCIGQAFGSAVPNAEGRTAVASRSGW